MKREVLTLNPSRRPLSTAAIRTLRVAAQRKDGHVFPLAEGVQGIAKDGLLRVLRERGYITSNPDKLAVITEKGRQFVARGPAIPKESI